MDLYEEVAEMFLGTLAGQMSRDELIAHFRAKFPSEQAFLAVVEATRREAAAIVRESEALLARDDAFGSRTRH